MKILITAFTGIGNGVLMTPLLSVLAARNDAAVYLIGDNKTGVFDVLRGLPQVKEIHKLDGGTGWRQWRCIWKWIMRQRFDLALLPFASTPLWFHPLVLLSNCRQVVQHISISKLRRIDSCLLLGRFLFGKRVTLVPLLQGRHETDLYLDLAEVALNAPVRRDHRTSIGCRDDADIVQRLGITGRFICLQPGAANGLMTTKRWSSESFVSLAHALRSRYPDTATVVVGAASEYSDSIKPILEADPSLINTAGKTTIGEVVSLMRRAELVISHDSGIMHLADAIGTPLIALYGPTDYTRTAPRGEKSTIIRKDLHCAPCMYGFKVGERESAIQCTVRECMDAISVADVLQAATRVLDKTLSRPNR